MLGFATNLLPCHSESLRHESESAAAVDAVCDAFEREWQEGRVPEIAAAVLKVDGDLRIVVAQQLMMVDAEYRRAKYGVAPSLEEYSVMLMVDLADLVAELVTLDGVGDLQNTPAGRVAKRSDDTDGEARPEERTGYRLGREARPAAIDHGSQAMKFSPNWVAAAWGLSTRLGRSRRADSRP